VGEPINLNVVNADCPRHSDYITEQYGINFVIDSSVVCAGTVNVRMFPGTWPRDDSAIQSSVHQVNGNILRVATWNRWRKKLRPKGHNDPGSTPLNLVTEFIR